MEYAEFLNHLDPVILALQSSSSVLDRPAFWALPDEDAERVLSSKYTLSKVGDDYFDVEATFSLSIHKAESDGRIEQALKIDCTFYGHFHAGAPVPEEMAKKFVETESWLLFWPFFRQFVADTVGRMSIPPIIVPLGLGPGDYRRKLPARTSSKPGTRATKRPKKLRGNP